MSRPMYSETRGNEDNEAEYRRQLSEQTRRGYYNPQKYKDTELWGSEQEVRSFPSFCRSLNFFFSHISASSPDSLEAGGGADEEISVLISRDEMFGLGLKASSVSLASRRFLNPIHQKYQAEVLTLISLFFLHAAD